MRRDDLLKVRCETAEKADWAIAASMEQVELSQWVRDTLNAASDEALAAASIVKGGTVEDDLPPFEL